MNKSRCKVICRSLDICRDTCILPKKAPAWKACGLIDMGYFGVQPPIVLSYLALQVDGKSLQQKSGGYRNSWCSLLFVYHDFGLRVLVGLNRESPMLLNQGICFKSL